MRAMIHWSPVLGLLAFLVLVFKLAGQAPKHRHRGARPMSKAEVEDFQAWQIANVWDFATTGMDESGAAKRYRATPLLEDSPKQQRWIIWDALAKDICHSPGGWSWIYLCQKDAEKAAADWNKYGRPEWHADHEQDDLVAARRAKN